MSELVKFEIKKIIKRKSSKVVIILSIMLSIFVATLSAVSETAFDELNNEYKGIQAIAMEKESFSGKEGYLTEDRIEDEIRKYQELYNNPNNLESKEYTYNYFDANAMLYYLISQNYAKENENIDTSFDNISNISLENGAKFYETRDTRVQYLLNMHYSNGKYNPEEKYSTEEKKFWTEKNQSIQEPYYFQYHNNWVNILYMMSIWLFCTLAICISVAPVFASEYQTKADSVILASKYGKTKVIHAKIIASLLFGTVTFIINIALSVIIIFLFYGIEGWNSSIQLYELTIPYNVTFLKAFILCLIIAYIIMLALVGFTLLLSSHMNSPFTVLIVIMLIFFIPAFMQFTGNRLYDHILLLLPIKAISVFGYLGEYISYQFGNFVISIMTMIIVTYLFLAVVFISFVGNGFKKHQVN